MNKDIKFPGIFLSYSWKHEDKKIADLIDLDFRQAGITFIRDIREIKYKDNLKKFMSKIREADFAIILLSENYLRSKNCMFEAIQVLKEKNYIKKVLPILVNKPRIFDPKERIDIIKFWKTQKEELEKKTKSIDPMNSIGILKELKLIDEIYDNIDFLLSDITNNLNISFEDLRNQGYKPLLVELGIKEISNIIDFIEIINIENIEDKEIALEEYFEKYEPNTYVYFYKGHLAEKKGKFKRARRNYLKALEKDSQNVEALYRLGEISLTQFNDVKAGKQLLEKVLEINPDHEGTLINMGMYYNYFENNLEKAKKFNTKVLEINPRNEKGYNNLAGCLIKEDIKRKTKENEVEVGRLLKKALEINPKYYDGLMTYSGYMLYYKDNKKASEKYTELAFKVRRLKDNTSLTSIIKFDD